MSASIETLLQTLKQQILACIGEGHAVAFILYGSTVTAENPRDVDIAIVLEDATDPIAFIRAISPIVANSMKSSGRSISCFPLSELSYRNSASQFVANVRNHGVGF